MKNVSFHWVMVTGNDSLHEHDPFLASCRFGVIGGEKKIEHSFPITQTEITELWVMPSAGSVPTRAEIHDPGEVHFEDALDELHGRQPMVASNARE